MASQEELKIERERIIRKAIGKIREDIIVMPDSFKDGYLASITILEIIRLEES